MSKVLLEGEEEAKDVLYHVIKSIILLIYPYCPFIAEEMYLSLPMHKSSIMEESYPEPLKGVNSPSSEKRGELLKQLIKDVRSAKSSDGLAPNAPVSLLFSPALPFKGAEPFLKRFLFANDVKAAPSLPSGGRVFQYGLCSMRLSVIEDEEEARKRLTEEITRLEGEVARGERMINNPGFLAKAPKSKVDLETEKLSLNRQKLEEARKRLSELERI